MDYKSIIDNIITQLNTAINDSSVDVINIYEPYDPDLRQSWIRVSLLPSESVNVSQGIDSILEHNGLIQIDVFTPKGTTVNFAMIDSIVKNLNEQRVISDLTLDRTWRGVDVIEETDWIRSPVFARFRYYQYNVSIND